MWMRPPATPLCSFAPAPHVLQLGEPSPDVPQAHGPALRCVQGPEFGFRHRGPGKRDRPYLVLKTPLEALAHVNNDADLDVLLAVHVIAEPAIEFDVLDETLVSV